MFKGKWDLYPYKNRLIALLQLWFFFVRSDLQTLLKPFIQQQQISFK